MKFGRRASKLSLTNMTKAKKLLQSGGLPNLFHKQQHSLLFVRHTRANKEVKVL